MREPSRGIAGKIVAPCTENVYYISEFRSFMSIQLLEDAYAVACAA